MYAFLVEPIASANFPNEVNNVIKQFQERMIVGKVFSIEKDQLKDDFFQLYSQIRNEFQTIIIVGTDLGIKKILDLILNFNQKQEFVIGCFSIEDNSSISNFFGFSGSNDNFQQIIKRKVSEIPVVSINQGWILNQYQLDSPHLQEFLATTDTIKLKFKGLTNQIIIKHNPDLSITFKSFYLNNQNILEQNLNFRCKKLKIKFSEDIYLNDIIVKSNEIIEIAEFRQSRRFITGQNYEAY